MYDYKRHNPDNSVKLKFPSGFPALNMKVLLLWKVKNSICWRILENILEKQHDDVESIAFVPLLICPFSEKKRKRNFHSLLIQD